MEGSRRSYDGQLGRDNLEVTELRLGLPGSESVDKPIPRPNKRSLPAEESKCKNEPKAQVVGWPPVRAHRRSSMQMRINKSEGGDENGTVAIYVKVSMDGAPYLRKIDLKVYKAYKDLRQNLEDMFKCFSLGEYVVAYEDKDGDWMMVGDVPWEMFTSTCKRLRIMKESEARGLGSS